MTTITKINTYLTLIDIFTVAPSNQDKLVGLLTSATVGSIRKIPGFVSSALHKSTDGTKVAMYAQWESLQHYQQMLNNPMATPYLQEAMEIATLAPGMYDVVETFTRAKVTLDDVKDLVNGLAAKIDAPSDSLPTYGYSKEGWPHIEETANGQFDWVVIERGQEMDRYFAADLNDLLYKIFSSVTSNMAGDFEVRHRIKGEDSRRQRFAKQEALLLILNPEWCERTKQYHQSVIANHPFRDT
ncbi:MAG: Imm63 family immunity protein [Flavipsychrobacter sp.]|nr:Imm63 family immunity protein [Flavipsychrobacter sp.]